MPLAGKRILLGICGSIAAYKSAELCRLLVAQGATVRVIMSPAACQFISPLTLSVLSKNPVGTELVLADQTWNNHVEWGLWADLFLIAPLTAESLSAFAHGRVSNLLQAVYLSARCKVALAPAMDHDMYLHPATQKNLEVLRERGQTIFYPASGELASGLIGEGRMQEPAALVKAIHELIYSSSPLKGKRVLITAGPTQEAIDPVRFISNHSSGKMGFALAAAFESAGAEVILVHGPVHLPVPASVHSVAVRTALEMQNQCEAFFDSCSIAVLCAAVADYRVKTVAEQKIKKTGDSLELELIKNPDILAGLGTRKRKDQFLAGFALETENELENAKEKLVRKNLDLIVMNSASKQEGVFGSDLNEVTFIGREGDITAFPLKEKERVADDIVKYIIDKSND